MKTKVMNGTGGVYDEFMLRTYDDATQRALKHSSACWIPPICKYYSQPKQCAHGTSLVSNTIWGLK